MLPLVYCEILTHTHTQTTTHRCWLGFGEVFLSGPGELRIIGFVVVRLSLRFELSSRVRE